MTDAGLLSLTALPRLSSLTIYNCPEITVAGLAELGCLSTLRQVNVYRCCQVGTPDVLQLQAEMPQCKLTIVSASQNETAVVRRRRLMLTLPDRIASLRSAQWQQRLAPSETNPTGRPAETSARSGRPVQTGDSVPLPEPTLQSSPRKNWWEVWR
jgi:hypothetical protein